VENVDDDAGTTHYVRRLQQRTVAMTR
jgi:hypothetical protein